MHSKAIQLTEQKTNKQTQIFFFKCTNIDKKHHSSYSKNSLLYQNTLKCNYL